jgi:hypothetical protein
VMLAPLVIAMRRASGVAAPGQFTQRR